MDVVDCGLEVLWAELNSQKPGYFDTYSASTSVPYTPPSHVSH